MRERDNIVLAVVELAAAEGWAPTAVTVARTEKGPWEVRVTRCGFVPGGEGGDLRRNTVTVDRSNMPRGVSVQGVDRVEDYVQTLTNNVTEEMMEGIVYAAAQNTGAADVKVTQYSGIRVSMLFKPNRFLPDVFFGPRGRPTVTTPKLIRSKVG